MKIAFRAVNYVPDEQIARNVRINMARGLPLVGEAPVRSDLAVVGGGPSIAEHIGRLRHWPGEIWAINGAFPWCQENGIGATFFTMDPAPFLAPIAAPAKRAILGSCCAPELFEAIAGEIEVFPFGELPSGSSSACTAPLIAAKRGHASITLFGCESSFGTQVHAFPWVEDIGRVLVSCGGADYLTTPQLIMQAEYVAEIARGVPGYVRVVGHGFLPALIAHGHYDVLKVSPDIAEALGGQDGA